MYVSRFLERSVSVVAGIIFNMGIAVINNERIVRNILATFRKMVSKLYQPALFWSANVRSLRLLRIPHFAKLRYGCIRE